MALCELSRAANLNVGQQCLDANIAERVESMSRPLKKARRVSSGMCIQAPSLQTCQIEQQPLKLPTDAHVPCLQGEVQAAQNDKAAAEDSHSRVTFEVEVLHFQVYLQAEMAPGRFLLAAEKGRVEGRSMPHLFHNLISLTLDQVSAAAMQASHCTGAAAPPSDLLLTHTPGPQGPFYSNALLAYVLFLSQQMPVCRCKHMWLKQK